MDGHGHVNECISVAQVLLSRGHRVVFAVDAVWKGKLSKYKFEKLYLEPNVRSNISIVLLSQNRFKCSFI